jgi:antitoxin HicB
MAAYPALFEPDHEKGGFVVTFPDLPPCITQGDSENEARAMAQDALAMMLSHIIGQGGEIPRPSARRGRKFRQIQLPPMENAKLDLYRAFRASGLRKAELARRMGIQKTNIDLLFDLERPSRFEQIEAAFRALGKRLVISVEEAA